MRFFILTLLMTFSAFTFAAGATTTARIDFSPILQFENSPDEIDFSARGEVSYTFEWFCSDGISDASVKEHIVQTTRLSEAYIPLTPQDRLCHYRYRGTYANVPGLWSDWFDKQFTSSDDVRILSQGRIESVSAL